MLAPACLQIPERIWIEMHDNGNLQPDACDVIVRMDDGSYFTAVFVTLPFLARQMDLSYEVGKGLPYNPPVRYAALETPHIIVQDLGRDTIEDTIDNLLALDVFENLFTQVTDEEGDEFAKPRSRKGKRATAEVAAVVLNEVLMVQDDTTTTVA
ncbi:MAG: hypothetical protein IAE80_27515 [Anaerolinea sp.]|nr:hypothetical protein [Anaerolinea sp.]